MTEYNFDEGVDLWKIGDRVYDAWDDTHALGTIINFLGRDPVVEWDDDKGYAFADVAASYELYEGIEDRGVIVDAYLVRHDT